MTKSVETVDPAIAVALGSVIANKALAIEAIPESMGPRSVDLPVRWAHVSELLDPAPYLLGQELLLTAGANLPAGSTAVDRYVHHLRSGGITALGFGITPAIHEVLPDALRAACVQQGLPLLVVPATTPFLAVSRAVALAISRAGQGEQLRITEAREALSKLATGGMDAVVRGLAQRISGWVAVIGPDNEIASDFRSPWPLPSEVMGLIARLRTGTGIRIATTELKDGSFVTAQPVYPQATAAHLLVVGRMERHASTDRAIIAVGATLLGVVSGAGSDNGRLGGATTSWLLGRRSPTEVVATFLQAQEHCLVAGVAFGPGSRQVEAGYEWLRSRLRTPLIEVHDRENFTAIVDRPPPSDVLAELLTMGWLVAVGRPHAADRLAEAVLEVRAVLLRAVALGRPMVASAEDGIRALVAPEVASSYAERLLEPLDRIDSDSPQATLVPTLHTWLAHHGSWDRTASALGIHRNSVRHRIGQVERALGVDLGDPETRMDLWFALRWGNR